MVQINFALREVNVKIVYYGPGRSGKTTNLEVIHKKAPKDSIGEMMSIATETDRTLFFDFLPLDLGKVAGMNTKFQLYTVPGQVYYKATRKLVLQGADGLVFVADSQAEMMEENLQSIADMEENLRENGLDINEIPLVFQWNKRDLENILPVEELNQKINKWNAPHFPGVAISGDGVFPTLKGLASVVIQKLNQDHGYGGAPEGAAAPEAAASAPAAPAPAAAVPPPPPPPAAAQPATPAAPSAPAEPATPSKSTAQALAAELEMVASQPDEPPAPPAAATPETVPVEELEAPPPAAQAKSTPPSQGETPTEDLNPIARELRKRREDVARKEQEQIERIRKSSHKPIRQKSGPSPAVLGVGIVIVLALAAIAYFLLF